MNQTTAENDVALIKATFKDNESLLKKMRALWFGLELSSGDKELIRSTFLNSELREAVRRKTYALMGDDAPIGSVPDFWLNITLQQLIGASKDTIYQIVQSRYQLLKLFRRAIALLESPDSDKIDLSFDPSLSMGDTYQINLIARNSYIQAMETTLHILNQIANQPEPVTPAQAAKKRVKDSAK